MYIYVLALEGVGAEAHEEARVALHALDQPPGHPQVPRVEVADVGPRAAGRRLRSRAVGARAAPPGLASIPTRLFVLLREVRPRLLGLPQGGEDEGHERGPHVGAAADEREVLDVPQPARGREAPDHT